MLTPPDGWSDETLVRALRHGWGLVVDSIEYRAVGFGSHHWEVVDAGGVRRFVTVDVLDHKRQSASESEAAAFHRLQAALVTARNLRDSGATFVIAPIPTLAGKVLMRTDRRFAVALYPYVDGHSYSWGDFSTPAHRRGVLDLIVELHTAPTWALRHVMADDFAVPHRDKLDPISDDKGVGCENGPYSRRTSRLLVESSGGIRRLLARYDDLVKLGRGQPSRTVVTHGEPHPGNTMLMSVGWVLIDWDTVLLAPPERDLWSLDPGDGSTFRAYADATGTMVQSVMLELYRIRWDLTDIAAYANQFRSPHAGGLNDDKSWDDLCSLVGRLPA